MMADMVRQAVGLLIVVALFGVGFVLFSPDGRQLLDRGSIALKRFENHWYYRNGQPLPGTPDLAKLDARLAAQGLQLGAPVFLRIFKLELVLELWMEKDGRYRLFATYPICLWSGRLGPKLSEGDLQAPEGFYTVLGSSSIPTAAGTAPSISASPMSSTAPMGAPAPYSWSMADASRLAAMR